MKIDTFFSTAGRLGRRQFVANTLITFFGLTLPILAVAVWYFEHQAMSGTAVSARAGSVAGFASYLLQCPHHMRRFRDIGASGWHYLWGLLPMGALIVWCFLVCAKKRVPDAVAEAACDVPLCGECEILHSGVSPVIPLRAGSSRGKFRIAPAHWRLLRGMSRLGVLLTILWAAYIGLVVAYCSPAMWARDQVEWWSVAARSLPIDLVERGFVRTEGGKRIFTPEASFEAWLRANSTDPPTGSNWVHVPTDNVVFTFRMDDYRFGPRNCLIAILLFPAVYISVCLLVGCSIAGGRWVVRGFRE